MTVTFVLAASAASTKKAGPLAVWTSPSASCQRQAALSGLIGEMRGARKAPASQSDDRFNTADVKPFRLVFSGGTALSRAHRLTRRMSEDIDLKIVSDERRLRAEFRELRDNLTSALLHDGFRFDPENAAHGDSGNASRYTIYRLPYTPLVTGEGALRPEIQIETAVWPLRLAPVEQSVTFFLGGGL